MILELYNVSLGYAHKPALIHDVNIRVGASNLIALIGRNGVGKSTLLRSLAGRVAPLSGDVRLDGQSIFRLSVAELARCIAFVSTENISMPHLKVRDVVAMGRSPYTNWLGTLSEQDDAIVTASLRKVSMESFALATIDCLSDGERQRIMIARALAQDTPVILLDEPTAFLDLPNRYQIAMLLSELAHTTAKTIIYSSHDLSTAIKICDQLWVMSPEGIDHGSPESLSQRNAYQVIFENTPLQFDSRTGEVAISGK